jgi:hypothetical protein
MDPRESQVSQGEEPSPRQSRAEKKKLLRERIKAMQEARTGRVTMKDQAAANTSKRDQRKAKKVVKSGNIDQMLAQVGVKDPNVKFQLQRAMRDGRIRNMDDMAKWLAENTNIPRDALNPNLLMQNSINRQMDAMLQERMQDLNLDSYATEKKEEEIAFVSDVPVKVPSGPTGPKRKTMPKPSTSDEKKKE